MIYIAHRGNIDGPSLNENYPPHLDNALSKGYHVEVDIWYMDDRFFSGHDRPVAEVTFDFLKRPDVWCHAKNARALEIMLTNKMVHCFWHETDYCTLTSKGIPWIYPGRQLIDGSVCVMPENGYSGDIKKCYGICSDNIEKFKEE